MDPIESQRSFKVEERDRRDSEGGVSVEEGLPCEKDSACCEE